ncbi:MAG: SDR family oxidoreductase [Lentisphaerota bacterium]
MLTLIVMILKGKTALITGGAVRIGRTLGLELARQGMNVAVHYHTSAPQAGKLVLELRRLGVRACAVKAPLNSEAGCRRLIAATIRNMGSLDVLINNAAVFHKQSFRDLHAKTIPEDLGINLIAPMLLIRFFAETVKAGKVVNLLDRRITGLDISCVPYVLSKKALEQATRLAALEYAPRITVNAIAPGAVLPPPGKGAKYLHDAAGLIPLQCRNTPEEIASAAVYLLSQDGMTGQVLFVDGGQHLLG